MLYYFIIASLCATATSTDENVAAVDALRPLNLLVIAPLSPLMMKESRVKC